MCVLVNMSSGSDKNRDMIAETVLVVECLAQLLVSFITFKWYMYLFYKSKNLLIAVLIPILRAMESYFYYL